MSSKETWGALELRDLRCRLGWSQAEMARRLGCTLQNIMNWEEGTIGLPHEFLRTIIELDHCAKSHSTRLKNLPLADEIMGEKSLSQMSHGELTEK